MGFLDKFKETFGGDDKAESFEVTFMEKKMGMTISDGKGARAVVTAGEPTTHCKRSSARQRVSCGLKRERDSSVGGKNQVGYCLQSRSALPRVRYFVMPVPLSHKSLSIAPPGVVRTSMFI